MITLKTNKSVKSYRTIFNFNAFVLIIEEEIIITLTSRIKVKILYGPISALPFVALEFISLCTVHVDVHVDVHADVHLDVHADVHANVHTDVHVDLHADVGVHAGVHADVHVDVDVDVQSRSSLMRRLEHHKHLLANLEDERKCRLMTVVAPELTVGDHHVPELAEETIQGQLDSLWHVAHLLAFPQSLLNHLDHFDLPLQGHVAADDDHIFGQSSRGGVRPRLLLNLSQIQAQNIAEHLQLNDSGILRVEQFLPLPNEGLVIVLLSHVDVQIVHSDVAATLLIDG